MEALLGIAILLIGSLFFAYYSQVPLAFLFSSFIALASSLFMFNLHGTESLAQEGPTFFMFGIIFITIGLWQIVEFLRNVLE
jgi:hypothetical protein